MSVANELFNHALTPKQQEAVDYAGEHMLIKGIAGSGKTTVLLRKALKIVQTETDTTIGVFTYNTTLAEYARALAEHIDPHRIKVYTFHSWAGTQLNRMQKNKQVVWSPGKVIDQILQSMRTTDEHRFFQQEKFRDFLVDEISWIKGKGLTTRSAYLECERTGRGSKIRVTEFDRNKIFDLFERYQRELAGQGKYDYDDFALELIHDWDHFPESGKIDHILVDEAQDLQQVQLQLLRMAARKTMVVAADKGQKIYKTSFAWRDIGINILGGRTKVLENSFRSTRQIIQLAHSLQAHDPMVIANDEEYVAPVYPKVEGPKPKVIACQSETAEEQMVLRLVQDLQRADERLTIGILARHWDDFDRLEKRFADARVSYELIKKKSGSVHTAGVKMTSFHSAKGLEFDVVIAFRLFEGNVPSIKQEHDEDEESLTTERRLFYVTMTRSKLDLYLSYAGMPSRFFAEMDENLYEKTEV